MMRARRALTRKRVASTVVLLGATSLLTDISSEMVSTVLPLYLVATLGFSPLQFGVIDGLYQGAGAFVRLGAGFLGDRLSRHKTVAAFGYGLSAICKLGLAVVSGAWGTLSAIILADRTGKGLRTAPRDAMISLSSRREDLGLAFGVHRAMDTAGAMIGPVLAFALLSAAPSGYHTLFLVSFLIALLGLGVLTLLVRQPRGSEAPAAEKPDLRAALALLRRRELRALTLAAAALGLVTVSDGFIYLTLRQRVDFSPALFPLLATGTAVTYMLLAVPAGRLADRWGRGRVLLGGYAILLAVYGLLLLPSAGSADLVLVLGLLGIYYAATDGVLAAMGSARAPEALRGSGLAILGTAADAARMLASIIFGALWVEIGLQTAIIVFAGGLIVAMALTARGLHVARA
ncbi:MAG TPA: MFS transporter [Solirubrobacteraceae bacterium]